jgi:hypothetical protein
MLICLAALTSSWNGTRLFGLQPVDVLLALAVVVGCLALVVGTYGLPRWIVGPALIIVGLAVLHMVAPTDYLYMAQRFQPHSNQFAPVEAESPIATAVQWLIALAVLPWLVGNVAQKAERPVEPIITASLVGAAVSAAVALSDYFGFSDIGEKLMGYGNMTGRESGLASHPNSLGFACLIAAPFAVRLLLHHRRWLIGLLLLGALVGGATVSGSRGAQLGIAGVLFLCLFLTRTGRAALWPAMYVGAWVGIAYLIFRPDLEGTFSNVLRFSSGIGTAASNSERGMLIGQGLRDFFHAPVIGIGFEVLAAAHCVYVQLLASGGLLLLGAMGWFWLGLIRASRRMARHGEVLGGFILCSTVAWLVVGAIENQLTERFLYFPTAIAVALVMQLQAEKRGDSVEGSGAWRVENSTTITRFPQAKGRGADHILRGRGIA